MDRCQSPNETPIARAVRTTSKSGGTVRVLPTMSSSGTDPIDGRLEGDHPVRLAPHQQLHRLAAEPRREHAIERRRRAAALQVAQHDRARFLARHLFQRRRDAMAHAAQALGAADARLLDERRAAAHRLGAFGDDDDREVRAPGVAILDLTARRS